jgi:hypothetical protein
LENSSNIFAHLKGTVTLSGSDGSSGNFLCLLHVGSGPFWLDPDPGLNKRPYVNVFGMCKRHKYFRNRCCLTFYFMNILFKSIFSSKKFPAESWPKIYLGQDLNVFKRRIRIQSKIVQIRNTEKQILILLCYNQRSR